MEKMTSTGMTNAAPSPRDLEGPAQLAASDAIDLLSSDKGDDRNPPPLPDRLEKLQQEQHEPAQVLSGMHDREVQGSGAAGAKFTEATGKEMTADGEEVEDIRTIVSALAAEGGIGLGREQIEADSSDDDDDDDGIPFAQSVLARPLAFISLSGIFEVMVAREYLSQEEAFNMVNIMDSNARGVGPARFLCESMQ